MRNPNMRQAYTAMVGMGILALSAVSTPAPAEESLSFDAALIRVETQNEALKAVEQDIQQRQAEREAAKGLHLPKVEAEVRENILNDPITLRRKKRSLCVADFCGLGLGGQGGFCQCGGTFSDVHAAGDAGGLGLAIQAACREIPRRLEAP